MNSCTYIAHTHILYIYKTVYCGVLTVIFFHKPCHKCFARSGPFCKSGHMLLLLLLLLLLSFIDHPFLYLQL